MTSIQEVYMRLESDTCNIIKVPVAFYVIGNVFENDLSTSPPLKLEITRNNILTERKKCA